MTDTCFSIHWDWDWVQSLGYEVWNQWLDRNQFFKDDLGDQFHPTGFGCYWHDPDGVVGYMDDFGNLIFL